MSLNLGKRKTFFFVNDVVFQVGDVIRCPYELTADETWVTLWHMLVYNPRTNEISSRMRRRLDTDRAVLPFALSFIFTLSLAVSR